METKMSVEQQSIKNLGFKSLKRSLDTFCPFGRQYSTCGSMMKKMRMSHKLDFTYGGLKTTTTCHEPHSLPKRRPVAIVQAPDASSKDLHVEEAPKTDVTSSGKLKGVGGRSRREIFRISHRPWKNYRVISGHTGSVRCIAFDPSNDWFCTGSSDRTIKIWDVASGRLRLTLTRHSGQVRGLAVSSKHTYMFSAGDDKQVNCWDLEQNKVIRSYHGHLSGVYCMALHPTLDILFTGGRDSVCRVWDIRTKVQVHALSGHNDTICSVFSQRTDPQVVTGSNDSTIRFWDIRYGKSMVTLTHHKKSVRAMVVSPWDWDCGFASASADSIKKFDLPKGEFCYNMYPQQKTIVNSMAVNRDGVLASGSDNGSILFWDWESGRAFQQSQTVAQPGSLDSEAGIYALSFDVTGSRLVSCEVDKTIKMWKEDEAAMPMTRPLSFKPSEDFNKFSL